MTVLYVVEQGAVVQKEGERLVVRKEGRPLASVPVFKVDSVVVFGGVQVSTQAIALLLGNGVELAFMSMDGRLKGRLMPAESRNVLLRLQQYQRYHDADFRLKLGRAVVRGKLSNARALIVRYARNHPEAP
ncbi:MAG: CRISPR-associated endonuclease Cas1, partial [Armatimonadota bacterium]|nr:CRISPR-associated endonuclease Cas1 [Armatimonadota bacterium]